LEEVISDKMTIDIDVFGMFVEDIITSKEWCSIVSNERSSDVVSTMTQYSVSILKLATTDCFLLFYEIREKSRRKQHPIMDCQYVGSPAESASK
jgi:hypothetical protein